MDLWEDELPPPRDELLRRVAGVDGVLTLLTDRVDDEFLDAAGPQLKVVSNYAVGFDNIDVAACARRGIPVGNTPGVLTETTADLAWSLLMAAARRACRRPIDTSARARGRRGVRCCCSGPMSMARRSASSGSGGSARRWRGGPRGSGWRSCTTTSQPLPPSVTDPLGATFVPLEELLPRSDFVSLHVNLTAETRHLINAETLRWMKPTAVLVNTSRGPVVDQAALAAALRDGRHLGGGSRRHRSGADPDGRPAGRRSTTA